MKILTQKEIKNKTLNFFRIWRRDIEKQRTELNQEDSDIAVLAMDTLDKILNAVEKIEVDESKNKNPLPSN